jgi:hypothetical protein
VMVSKGFSDPFERGVNVPNIGDSDVFVTGGPQKYWFLDENTAPGTSPAGSMLFADTDDDEDRPGVLTVVFGHADGPKPPSASALGLIYSERESRLSQPLLYLLG